MTRSATALEAVVRHDGHVVARAILHRGRYIIGSDRKNEILVDAGSVSGKHARLTVVGDDRFLIEDLGSANGTTVDGQPIAAQALLTLASRVGLGEATLTFERAGLPASIFPLLPEGFLRTARYAPGAVIVEGRTSTIREARDTLLGRTVALRILRPELQGEPAPVLAFIREAQIAAQLGHAGILPIYDFGCDDEIGLFAATRFVEGENLGALLDGMASGDPAAPQATLFSLLTIFQKACSAVACAHHRGVTHGALRPEAILFGRFGEVFVEHWGHAFASNVYGEGPRVDLGGALSRPPLPDAPRAPLSRYSAPEETGPLPGDISLPYVPCPATDTYALGAILFRILTLRHFCPGTTPEEVRRPRLPPLAALHEHAAPAHCLEGLPAPLAAICARALSAEPQERFPTAHELKKEISNWLEGAVSGGDQRKIWKQLAGLVGRH